MRPGPIGPGNARSAPASVVVSSGFNEARPNWAGKFRQHELLLAQAQMLQ